MSGSWNKADFPNLVLGAYKLTSPQDRRYNCIAWAADDDKKKWWPDPFGIGKWPSGVPRNETIQAFEQAFQALGYARCPNGKHEKKYEKIALYATPLGPTHAARQLPNGNWTSKLGDFEDIEHFTVDGVDGPLYGTSVLFMRRRRKPRTPPPKKAKTKAPSSKR